MGEVLSFFMSVKDSILTLLIFSAVGVIVFRCARRNRPAVILALNVLFYLFCDYRMLALMALTVLWTFCTARYFKNKKILWGGYTCSLFADIL